MRLYRIAPYHNYHPSILLSTVLTTTTHVPHSRALPPPSGAPPPLSLRSCARPHTTPRATRAVPPPDPCTAPHRPAHAATPPARVCSALVVFWGCAPPRALPGASCCGLRQPGSPRRRATRAAASGHAGKPRAARDACGGLRPRREAPGSARRVPKYPVAA